MNGDIGQCDYRRSHSCDHLQGHTCSFLARKSFLLDWLWYWRIFHFQNVKLLYRRFPLPECLLLYILSLIFCRTVICMPSILTYSKIENGVCFVFPHLFEEYQWFVFDNFWTLQTMNLLYIVTLCIVAWYIADKAVKKTNPDYYFKGS